ncbi:CHAT domain-containing tetratricopeptide repeat protein [Pseudotenacibaculum sp. MALMAid0570]|uniref:CHAT domain-containing tetratricopeptide repeat protein n=1 Tax=Pseudotenacibaculum sp. MALMAid0570 TaxID=3143938 RepID=UPI0032DFC959
MHSQNYFEVYKKLKTTNKSNLERTTDSLITLSEVSEDFKSLAKIAHDYSINLFRKRNYFKALKYANVEVRTLESIETVDKTYSIALHNLGLFYRLNYQYEEAVECQIKVINLNNYKKKTGQAYAELGRIFLKKGKYSEAKDYIKKGNNILRSIKDYRNLYSNYISLVTVLEHIDTKQSIGEALMFMKKISELKKNIKFSSAMNLNENIAYANLYSNSNIFNLEKAKSFYFKILDLSFKSKDSLLIGRRLSDISHIYNLKKNDSAQYYLKESENYMKTRTYDRVYLYENFSDYYLLKRDYKKSLLYLNKAIDFDQLNPDYLNNSNIKSKLFFIRNKEKTLSLFIKKMKVYILMYHKLKEQNYILKIEKLMNTIDDLVAIINNSSNEESTQLIWRREASQAYLYGSYAAHLLGDADLAFSYMEKSKALLLSEGVLKNTEFQNLPKHISDKDTQLKKQMYELENHLASQESKALQDSLFNAKIYYEKYVDSLQLQFPKYFDRKINVTQVPLSEVQQELSNNEAVISYIWNNFDDEKEIALGLVTTKTSATTFEIDHVDSLKARLIDYKRLISKPFATREDQKRYQKVAYQLHQQLIPEEVQESIKGKDLLIIPDGDLQNLPFEAFITSKENNHYLIQDTDISYSYSYSFLQHNKELKRETKQSFIGYSPINFESLPSLQNSKLELEQINTQFEGVVKLQDTASKEDFLANSSQSQIIHLATHADAGKNPWIAFSDGKLELHELYTYKNNADLVTLSACNTSLGEVAKGEGVLSLARGFFYSGSKSVVSSLWEVNDKSTSGIMTDFYKNLNKGETKLEALNNAKRRYLKTHELSAQSPYYWSSFILIGDAGELDKEPNYFLYIAIVVGVLFLLFLFRKKSKFIG